MPVMILGLVLWTAAHLFKRVAPGLRWRLGEMPGKMVVSVLVIASVALMVVGYRRAETEAIYEPLAGMGHLNNLLMLASVFLIGVPHSKGVVRSRIRHPMLVAVILWAIAHLLVNGDLASIVLFGTLGIWAVASIVLINAQQDWAAPAPGRIRSDAIGVAITLAVYAIIAAIHIWLGHNPFLGTYP